MDPLTALRQIEVPWARIYNQDHSWASQNASPQEPSSNLSGLEQCTVAGIMGVVAGAAVSFRAEPK